MQNCPLITVDVRASNYIDIDKLTMFYAAIVGEVTGVRDNWHVGSDSGRLI